MPSSDNMYIAHDLFVVINLIHTIQSVFRRLTLVTSLLVSRLISFEIKNLLHYKSLCTSKTGNKFVLLYGLKNKMKNFHILQYGI